MGETEAAIQAATISVWGAVTVGVLATLGTVTSALIAPFLIRRAEEKARERTARLAALRLIIPRLVADGIQHREGEVTARASMLGGVADLEMWLEPDEWQIGRIAAMGFFGIRSDPARSAVAQVTAMYMLSKWARGAASADDAAQEFTRRTGLDVRPWEDLPVASSEPSAPSDG